MKCDHGTPINTPCDQCAAWLLEQHEPSDNPFVDILAALHRIDEKLDRLARPIAGCQKEYLTVAEAASHFNLSPTTLYRLKRLQVRRGRSVRFRRSDLERHLLAARAA